MVNARYFITAFPTSTLDNRFNIECPCGAFFASHFPGAGGVNATNNGVLSLNTTGLTAALPVQLNVQYTVVVTAACLQEDGCAPSTVYTQLVSAPLVTFTAVPTGVCNDVGLQLCSNQETTCVASGSSNCDCEARYVMCLIGIHCPYAVRPTHIIFSTTLSQILMGLNCPCQNNAQWRCSVCVCSRATSSQLCAV